MNAIDTIQALIEERKQELDLYESDEIKYDYTRWRELKLDLLSLQRTLLLLEELNKLHVPAIVAEESEDDYCIGCGDQLSSFRIDNDVYLCEVCGNSRRAIMIFDPEDYKRSNSKNRYIIMKVSGSDDWPFYHHERWFVYDRQGSEYLCWGHRMTFQLAMTVACSLNKLHKQGNLTKAQAS